MKEYSKNSVSVLIPAYNAEKTLARTLNSVLWQNVPDMEIIVCNDGSTDRTGDILEVYSNAVKVIRNPENLGVGKARQKLVEAAANDYICFLDADDCLPDKYLENLLKRARGADVVISAYSKRGKVYSLPEGAIPKREIIEGLGKIRTALASRRLWGKLWKRELFDGIEIPDRRICEDEAVYPELILKAESFIGVPETVYRYNPGGISDRLSVVEAGELVKTRFKTFKKFGPKVPGGFWPGLKGLLFSASVLIRTLLSHL